MLSYNCLAENSFLSYATLFNSRMEFCQKASSSGSSSNFFVKYFSDPLMVAAFLRVMTNASWSENCSTPLVTWCVKTGSTPFY